MVDTHMKLRMIQALFSSIYQYQIHLYFIPSIFVFSLSVSCGFMYSRRVGLNVAWTPLLPHHGHTLTMHVLTHHGSSSYGGIVVLTPLIVSHYQDTRHSLIVLRIHLYSSFIRADDLITSLAET